MAEKVIGSSSRGTHESSTLSYGTFGTASYETDSQRWLFLRNEDPTIENVNEKDALEHHPNIVILTDPEVIVTNSPQDCRFSDFTAPGNIHTASDIQAASRFVETPTLDKDENSTAISWFALGAALWLSADDVESGNLTVPVSAHVAGEHAQKLEIACHGRQTLDNGVLEEIRAPIQIPQLLAGPKGSWSNGQAIEQVVFSGHEKAAINGSFLAIRHTSGISILQPLLRGNPATPGSHIDSNILLTIPVTSTGGCKHSDVSFSPHDQRVLATTDIEGNWSIWKIRGRRSKKARTIYQAYLLASGKLFSWDSRQRPTDVQLYFDGWHRAVWISTSQEPKEELLVCNRKEAKVFHPKSGASFAIDLRLDTRKRQARVLDAILGPRPGTCFILTTQSILLYNFTQTDWRSAKRPALVCAWLHNRASENATLKLTKFESKGGFAVVLYSGQSSTISIYNMRLTVRGADLIVSSSLSNTLSIPGQHPSPISSMFFASSETSNRFLQSDTSYDLLQILIQHNDLTLRAVLASLRTQEDLTIQSQTPDLTLPPKRSVVHHSERYVDQSEDDADVAGLVVQSQYDQTIESMPTNIDETLSLGEKNRGLSTRDFGMLFGLFMKSGTHNAASSMQNLSQAWERIEDLFGGSPSQQEGNRAYLLSELVGFSWRTDDIDTEITAINEATSVTSGKERWTKFDSVTSCSRLEMPDLYDNLFTTYISHLPTEFPNRSRLARERVVRNTAFDLYMSALVLQEQQMSFTRPQTAFKDSQPISQILSDPVLPPDEDDQSVDRPLTSASQPENRAVTQFRSSTPTLSTTQDTVLENALARLSNFTEVKRPRSFHDADNQPLLKQIQSLLSHIPADLQSHPENYDWQAHEISNSTRENGADSFEKPASARKRDKLARAQKKAESLLPKHGDVPMISSTAEKAKLAALPIRNWPDPSRKHVAAAFHVRHGNTSSQPALNATMSDGIDVPEHPSQTQETVEQISATQPVRGAFAGRPDPFSKGRPKKKRRAGF